MSPSPPLTKRGRGGGKPCHDLVYILRGLQPTVGDRHKSPHIKGEPITPAWPPFRFRGVVPRWGEVCRAKSHERPTRVKEVMARFGGGPGSPRYGRSPQRPSMAPTEAGCWCWSAGTVPDAPPQRPAAARKAMVGLKTPARRASLCHVLQCHGLGPPERTNPGGRSAIST